MQVQSFILNLTSDQPEKLNSFYRDTVGLPLAEGMGPGAMLAGGAVLVADGHSEISGPAREPQRVLINLMVDDLAAEETRLKSHGVRFIRERGREEWGGIISTFLDPDGNYVQLMEYRPE